MKNIDLDSRIQIWLLFGPELIEKQTNVKVMKMTQISKYDYSIMAGMKSTKTKHVLKDNTKQTRYDKTRPNSGT